MRQASLKNSGLGLLEAVIAIAVISIALAGLVGLFRSYAAFAGDARAATKAAFLVEEGQELMRTLRDESWSAHIASLSSDTDYYVSFDGTSIMVNTTPAYIDGEFDRVVTLADVYRDGGGAISDAENGSLDAGTRRITVSVARQGRAGTTTRAASTYLTDLFGN